MFESVRKGPYSKQWCNHQLNELISVPDNQDSGTANKRIKRPSARKGPDSTPILRDRQKRSDSTPK